MEPMRRLLTPLVVLGCVACGSGWDGAPPGRSTGTPAASAGESNAQPAAASRDHAPLEPVDERHQGELVDGDFVLQSDDSRYDEYSFEAPAGASIVVVMRSEELEPYLHLLGPDGAQLAHGGAPPGERGVAEVVLVAPRAAEYTVYANALEPAMRGHYELRIVVEPPPRPAEPEPASETRAEPGPTPAP